jgi:hypothetical protein
MEQVSRELPESCKAGNHRLVKIMEISQDPLSEQVVRWCVDCGSITIDVDYDGRTQPGRIMRMKSPNISKVCETNRT